MPARSRPEFLDALIRRALDEDGQPPFNDQALVEFDRGERELVHLGTDAAAIAGRTEFELVVDPAARGRGLGARLLAEVLPRYEGEVLAWAHGDHPASRALAAPTGFEAVRTLLQLRAPVPAEGPEPASLRAFDPATDASTLLTLNARAFAHHREQGGMTRDDLDARIAEPWFDRDDLLLLERDGSVAGFCWLKVEDGIGEFHVVGVDPDHQGQGLGRVLVDAGFARLRARGIRVSSLYVEADNEPALRLYRSRGFTDHTIDVQYRRSLPVQRGT